MKAKKHHCERVLVQLQFFHGISDAHSLLDNVRAYPLEHQVKSAEAMFSITGWEESNILEMASGAKITKAKVHQRYQGDLEATSVVDYLMTYSADGTAQFVGYESVSGSIGDLRGSFVIQHEGTFSAGVARSSWTVVKGAGSGDFVTLYGLGDYIAGHDGTAKVMFSFEC